jgi:hypothetical protein
MEAAGRPGLYSSFLNLLGAPQVETDSLQIWIIAWRTCLQALHGDNCPPRLDPNRLPYYQHAFDVYLDGDQPIATLWPLLRTWTLAASQLPAGAEELTAWKKAFTQLGLLGSGFGGCLEALDAYLDGVDDLLESWARANGV